MRNIKSIILIACAICCASTSFSQLPMGGWQTFFSYNHAGNMIQSKDKIYALSDGNLYSIDKEYESIETYTKLTGLTDGNITKIAYCQSQNTLVIVYDNCNIDLLTNSRIINVNDLKRAEVSNKKVNGVTIDGKYAYLACGFGITVLDVEMAEIVDTYILGEKGTYVNVENIVFHNDSIYAQSGNTIRYAAKKDKNLADFNRWQTFHLLSEKAIEKGIVVNEENADSLMNEGDILPISKIYAFNNSLLIRLEDVLIKRDSSVTRTMELPRNASLSVDDLLIVSKGDSMVAFNDNLERVVGVVADSVIETLYDPQSKAFWICDFQADGRTIIQKYARDGRFMNYYVPDGPVSGEIAFVKYQDGKLFTGSGGPFDRPLSTPGIVQFLENGRWSIITEMGMDSSVLRNSHFLDVIDIASDPQDNNHFFVSAWKGLFEFQGISLINHFTGKNSQLSGGSNTLVDGLKYDKDGNLWMLNMLSPNPIHILTSNREWYQLSYSQLQSTDGLRDLFIDSKGYLWVIKYRDGTGVFCADLNGTPLDEQDDKKVFISTFYDKDSHPLIPTTIRCITEDMDGVIWIGTDKGPLLVPDASQMFDSDFRVDRVKITREDNANYADYLLENEQINAIVIDGNNRKWVGTNSTGLYLLSADGKETIHHFTTENCPFTSNAIMDLFLNNETGELYITTASGLFLYQTDAIKGAESYSKVYAYPNPVRENYNGPVTITGLMENSQVRISDAEGRIIHEGDSNGGVYVWDGKDKNGRKVNTGIYFIYAAQPDGSSKMVTKMAVIN
ncbi:MAG: hypothetical protein IKP27_11805 [Paludibacteraceae bacterium]|nr:hypothetical protein [Paludibacteraceae bacterium]